MANDVGDHLAERPEVHAPEEIGIQCVDDSDANGRGYQEISHAEALRQLANSCNSK
jgi:hypothetical protein